jgi:putative ABC transport system substrate-binding protein
VRRREFIAGFGSAAAWPVVVRAQQAEKILHIGFLGFGPPQASMEGVEALKEGLRDLGYVEGKNIVIDFQWAESVDQFPMLAADLVHMNVDVIFARSSTEVEPARHATKTIPIVFATHADPVGVGHVASLARPGGNITGLSMLLTDLSTKELQIIREALPHSSRIGVLWNPTTPSHVPALEATEATGEKFGIELVTVAAQTVDDLNMAFAKMAGERVDGFLVLPSPLTRARRVLLAELELKHQLPGIFGIKDNVQVGGLMSYGADVNDLNRRAAAYIDKILKGAKPAELPVEQATKYELVINLKTANALGLTIPETLLATADEVIQ